MRYGDLDTVPSRHTALRNDASMMPTQGSKHELTHVRGHSFSRQQDFADNIMS